MWVTELTIREEDLPTVMFHGGGGKPNVRIILVNGAEVHRCEVKRWSPGGLSCAG